jgi:hypothetical protein
MLDVDVDYRQDEGWICIEGPYLVEMAWALVDAVIGMNKRSNCQPPSVGHQPHPPPPKKHP